MHQPRVLAALALSSLLLVTSCNGDSDASEPKKTFTPTADSSPSASEAESTYTPPEPAKPPKGGWPEDKPATEISAEAVARIWVKVYANALRTGDASRLKRLSGKSCNLCNELIEDLEALHQAGGSVRFSGKSFVAGEVTNVDTQSAPLINLQMYVSASAGKRVSEAGDEPSPFKAENFVWFFDLKPSAKGSWQVVDAGFAE